MQLNREHPRSSALLNIHDPVAMHLLMETAISDSKDFEILSFEEVEQLKKERSVLRSRVEGARRKLALEMKLRDAASSLNRLYSTKGRPPSGEINPGANGLSPPNRNKRRSFLGGKSTENDALRRADDEYVASSRKVEEYTQELANLETRLQNVDRRILEHTSGILQMTHKGLKKNIRKPQLPHSPESMTSRNASRMDALDEFDERSLYQVPDYVTESGMMNRKHRETSSLQEVTKRLDNLAKRLHNMIMQSGPQEHFDAPPQPTDEHISGNMSAQVQAQIGYVSQGLDAMEAVQARTVADAQKTMFDSEDQLEDVNVKLHNMLQRTNSVSKSPVIPEDEPRGKDLQSQLAFSTIVLGRLNSRIESLVEQKDILTRQIQQQRELNSKSDAQRDAKIHELNEQLEAAQKQHSLDEQEAHQTRDQLNLLMEQFDQAKQHSVLLEQRSVSSDVLETEKTARQKSENAFKEMESQFVQAQTELTMVKAELDASYGSRAQRAADVSSNPAVQKEIDNLKKELKETIEDYEVMTKQSIEAEKDRDKYEEKIDQLERRCDGLESQLNEEKVKWMGVKSGAPNDTTSSMVLKNEFKKMMRETKAEQIKAYKVRNVSWKNQDLADVYQAEQEERRRLEGIIRSMRKDMGIQTPLKRAPTTPNPAEAR
jgi:Up-regulated During Septation